MLKIPKIYKKKKPQLALSSVILLSVFFVAFLIFFNNSVSFENLGSGDFSADNSFTHDASDLDNENIDLVSSGFDRDLVFSGDGERDSLVNGENVVSVSSSEKNSGPISESVVSSSESGFVSGLLGASAQSSDDVFSSVWDTSKGSGDGVSLPLVSGGDYDFTVDWGDGNTSQVTSFNDADKSHTYASGGVYTVNITGKIKGFSFNNGGDKDKFIRIENWGVLNLGMVVVIFRELAI